MALIELQGNGRVSAYERGGPERRRGCQTIGTVRQKQPAAEKAQEHRKDDLGADHRRDGAHSHRRRDLFVRYVLF